MARRNINMGIGKMMMLRGWNVGNTNDRMNVYELLNSYTDVVGMF